MKNFISATLMFDIQRVVECGTCETAYHEGCAEKAVSEKGACVCGSEINLADGEERFICFKQNLTACLAVPV